MPRRKSFERLRPSLSLSETDRTGRIREFVVAGAGSFVSFACVSLKDEFVLDPDREREGESDLTFELRDRAGVEVPLVLEGPALIGRGTLEMPSREEGMLVAEFRFGLM